MVGKAILMVHSHLHLCVSLNVFQEDLFCDFSRHQNEADWPVDPWIIVFIFSEDGCHGCLFLVSRDLTQSP